MKNSYLLRRPVLLFLIIYCGGLVVLKKTGRLDAPGPQDPAQWAGQKGRVTGIVAEPPDPNPKGLQLILKAETLRCSTATVSLSGKILVQLMKAPPDFAAPGDRVSVWGVLQRPSEARVPGSFDYAEFLSHKDIHTQMFAGARSAENTGPSGTQRFGQLGYKIRNRLINCFQRHLKPEEAAVLSGLVVGSRPRFHPEIKRIFTESGTMHVLVASGSNVAFVVGLWFLITRLLFRLTRRMALGSSLPAIWAYVLVAGADPPIFRAGVMTSIGIAAYLLAREDKPYHALGLAALSLLLPAPNTLFDIGFQMSFVTVFGMLYYLAGLDSLWPFKNSFGRWTFRLLAAGWTAQLWVMPITLSVFKRIFPVSLLSNMLIIPLAGGGLTIGLLLSAADFLHGHFSFTWPFLNLVSRATGIYLRGLIFLARFFAEYPGISYWTSNPGITWTVGYYGLLLCLAGMRRSVWARIGGGIGVALLLIGWTLQARDHRPPTELNVTWIDMGRSLTLLIETSEGEKILMNPASSTTTDPLERTLMPYLSERGIKKFDAVFFTTGVQASTSSLTVGKILFEPLPGSGKGTAHIPFLITYADHHLVIGKTIGLKAQDALLEKNLKQLDLIQARFSEKSQWRDAFVKKLKPNLLVETGFDSDFYPSCPPWEDVPVVVPQKWGVFTWKAGGGGKN